MSASLRVSILLLGLLLVGSVTGRGPSSALASPRPIVAPDTTDDSSAEPYVTDRSLAYHVLAAPAYVLHGLTRPIGWGVKYLEQEYPELFEFRPRMRGALPRLELGGPTRFLAGATLFDRRLFGSRHSARIAGLYGGPETFRTSAFYEIPELLGPRTTVKTATNFFSDPTNGYFLGGNDSAIGADKALFFRRQVDVRLGLRVASDDLLRGGMDVKYEHVTTEPGDGLEGDRMVVANPPGLGTVELLTSQVLLGFDLTQGERRTYWGTELFLQLAYAHDFNSDQFQYGRYVAELRQYLPVGFFPKSRRLVVRARLEQVQPLFGGSAVPFYQLPTLGGKRFLRGFRANRFQDDGSLLLSAEYRYPIWSNVDAALFADAGQVLPEFAAIALDRFHWSYGGGIHLLKKKGLSFRFEVARSREGLRTVLTVEPSFETVVR